MEYEFWYNQATQNQVSLFKNSENSHLKTFWSKTSLFEGAHVLVPLCGKSKDMVWLCEHGFNVTGVEMNETTLKDFCRENNINLSEFNKEKNNHCQIRPDFSLVCSDFFHLSSEDLGEIDAVYDRTALINLPPELHLDYVNHLDALLKTGARIFLVANEFDQTEQYGPPFSVSEADIYSLFSEKFEIEPINTDVMNPSEFQINNEKVIEKTYLLTKK